MKKKLFHTLSLLLFLTALTLPGCEFLEDCGTCELVTDDGTDIVTSPALYYCGDEYYNKVNSSSSTIAGVTTYWNCD